MTFTIQNIGKIRHARVKLDGITLIVGDNNTGKTTIGRVLNTFYEALHMIDSEVDSQRLSQAVRCIRRFYDKFRRPFALGPIIDAVKTFVADPNISGDNLREYLQQRFYPRASREDIEELMSELETVRSLTRKMIRHQIIADAFDREFSSQVLSIDRKGIGMVQADIDGHRVSIEFTPHGVVHSSDINIQGRAFLISSPDMLNRWGQFRFSADGLPYTSFNRCLNAVLNPVDEVDSNVNSVENLLIADRYNRFEAKIVSLTGGHFNFDKNNILRFDELSEKQMAEGQKNSFEISNVSEGLKAFGVIELMLRHRLFKDGDVLIFDEPEIRLHPAWQMKYARLIVELQNEFNLKVLITTHSSNFMLALQMYAMLSQQSGRERVSVYHIKPCADDTHYSDVTSKDPLDWDDAYMSFITAAQEMNKLRSKAFEVEH